MLRILMFLGASAALLSAFALYTVSYQTRQLSEANQRMENEIATTNSDIAIMRAERAYQMRPGRIEPLARKLGMEPVSGRQFITPRELHGQPSRP